LKEKKDFTDKNMADQTGAAVVMINSIVNANISELMVDYSPRMVMGFAVNVLLMPLAGLFASLDYTEEKMIFECEEIIKMHFQKYKEINEEKESIEDERENRNE
jgi:hypothetical protein